MTFLQAYAFAVLGLGAVGLGVGLWGELVYRRFRRDQDEAVRRYHDARRAKVA